jgi:hypothetical protein
MYVAIRRYGNVAETSDAAAQDGRELSVILSKAPGFISFALMESDDGAFVSVSFFETEEALDGADQLIDRWAVLGEGRRKLVPTARLTRGEVVAQRGV